MPAPTLFSRVCAVLCAVLLLAAPSQAQDEKIVTGVEMSKEALQQFNEMNEMDARSIIGMLNEGLFALECASPKKMRAIVMFLTEDGDVMRVEGEPVEMEPGRHSAEGVMPGDNVSDAWEEVMGREMVRKDSGDAHSPERTFSSEREMAETMRDEMKVGDGRVGLVMFLTVADREMAEEMGDALQIRPMGWAFNAGNAGNAGN